jgi:hypothetical protein
MKKIIFIVIALFMLNNCGYTPIYSSKNNNFYIEILQKDKSKLNSKIENNIKKYSNQNSKNTIKLEISSNKKIDVTSKDSKGDPLKFQMTVSLKINNISKNNYKINKTKSFFSNFNYNNNSNKFSLKQYEKEIEDILINKITEETIMYLSQL